MKTMALLLFVVSTLFTGCAENHVRSEPVPLEDFLDKADYTLIREAGDKKVYTYIAPTSGRICRIIFIKGFSSEEARCRPTNEQRAERVRNQVQYRTEMGDALKILARGTNATDGGTQINYMQPPTQTHCRTHMDSFGNTLTDCN